MRVLLAVLLCLVAQTSVATSFDKTGEQLTITVINYEDKSELLKSYNDNPATRNPITNGDSIDGYALYSEAGTTCMVHVYKHPRDKTYQSILGHEIKHCIEGNFH
jgi:hypothetical protein|tara:strand:- start:78 stop:392 length:315 start_codon:yes stop_codon:yes gene_type:complete